MSVTAVVVVVAVGRWFVDSAEVVAAAAAGWFEPVVVVAVVGLGLAC